VRPLYPLAPAARLLFNATLIVWLLAEVRQSRRRRHDAVDQDAGSRNVIRVTIVAAFFLAGVASGVRWGRIHAPRTELFAVGIVLMWAGIGFRFWAFATLGRYFTFTVMTSADQPVVSSGPYRIVRHPSYAGALLALIGIAFVQGSWLSLAVNIVIPAVGMVNRIRVEESALVAALGEPYVAYAAGRKRLMPFVW